ncbi:MAG TPA: MBL fold metallo-hydrolase [Candidatus Acidoferrales bacterium]|jgi:glyoxylase-like metal-dependent hydrolase (beta-lactamase superfamily II)|nr:MBL fold metallo-hydrolase [Candidatus Acidoferrales bacterium]
MTPLLPIRRPATFFVFALFGIVLTLPVTIGAQETAPLGHNQSQPPPLVPSDKAIKVSDHVYVIPDGRVNLVPNIGLIIGTRATLVVDAGMGPRNGETVLRQLAKFNKNSDLYFTTTHFHPEHVTGVQAFPANTLIIRSEVQEEEVRKKQPQFIANFSKRTPEIKALLQEVKPRPPDILFDHELKLDLGGLTARIFQVGPGHTRGDTAIYVEEDKVLFTGDVVVNRFFPIFPDPDASGKHWLTILDGYQALQPLKVVPGHGEVGDASLITAEQSYLKALRVRTGELKAQGKSAKDTAESLTPEFQKKYPDWENPGWIQDAVEHFYSEPD